MPESFFVVSKENPKLAAAEIAAIARSYDRSARVGVYANMVRVRTTTPWQKIYQRASYAKESGRIMRILADMYWEEDLGKILARSRTYACRILNLAGNPIDPASLYDVGYVVSKHTNARVSLRNPDFVVYYIGVQDREFWGFSTSVQKHMRPKRVGAHPSQLDSKLTRAMINLCGLREGETVCDPFCGTGTTLLEAESMGVHGIGMDIDRKMSNMARINVAENGYGSEVINDDFRHIAGILGRVDGVVTDIPYGQNTKAPTEPKILIRDLIGMLSEKRFAIMCKAEFAKGIRLKGIKKYSIYRHKSLTRTVLVK